VYEFDAYINKIIGSLKVDKKQKDEIVEEFNDHLYMLKKEFIENGMTEENAAKEAIKTFGDSMDLKKYLSRNIIDYKTIYNILFGILLLVSVFGIGAFISVPGYAPTKEINVLLLLPSTLLFIAFGYFLPIIFYKLSNIKYIALISVPLSLTLGITISIIHSSILINLMFFCIVGGLTGSVIGFSILLGFNKIVYTLRCS
jgi:hypothetical protein